MRCIISKAPVKQRHLLSSESECKVWVNSPQTLLVFFFFHKLITKPTSDYPCQGHCPLQLPHLRWGGERVPGDSALGFVLCFRRLTSLTLRHSETWLSRWAHRRTSDWPSTRSATRTGRIPMVRIFQSQK